MSSLALPTTEQSGFLYEMVAHGVRLRATCERGHQMVLELIQRMGLGGWSVQSYLPHLSEAQIETAGNTPPPTPTPPPMPPQTKTCATPSVEQPSRADQAPRLSELIELHLGNMKRGKRGERSATRERRYILSFLKDVIGDKPVAAINVQDATTFVDVLAVWPAYRHNHPDFKNMSAVNIAAMAKLDKLRPIHTSTQEKHIKALRAFFNWCIESQVIKEDPFRFVQLSRYRDPMPRKKEVFSTQDLRKLFDADRMRTFTEPHKFWTPLIAFFSGMRVNEISQLYLDDIKEETVSDENGAKHTLLYFDVSPFREGQSVKSAYSRRRIPIHPQLLALGFEAYLADVRKSGAIHVFPGLSWECDGPGRVMTRWFNGSHLRKACGITSHAKTLHCFRHTITTIADRCLVPKSIMRTINGHSDGGRIDERSYVVRGSLLECRRALEKIEFPDLDLVPYEPGRFTDYLNHARENEIHRKRLAKEGKPVSPRRGRPPKRLYSDRVLTVA